MQMVKNNVVNLKHSLQQTTEVLIDLTRQSLVITIFLLNVMILLQKKFFYSKFVDFYSFLRNFSLFYLQKLSKGHTVLFLKLESFSLVSCDILSSGLPTNCPRLPPHETSHCILCRLNNSKTLIFSF